MKKTLLIFACTVYLFGCVKSLKENISNSSELTKATVAGATYVALSAPSFYGDWESGTVQAIQTGGLTAKVASCCFTVIKDSNFAHQGDYYARVEVYSLGHLKGDSPY